MIKKSIINFPDYSGLKETDKIEFFRKIKTKKLDAMSVIYKDVSPDIVKQASLFVRKMNTLGKVTAIDGVIKAEHFTLYSHEYIKEDNDWILYLNFKVDMKEGVEFTKLSPLMRFAVANIDGINYLAYEGSKKVFIVSQAFSGSFGYMDLNKLNAFMAKKPARMPYRLSNIAEEAYLADAPAQLFGKDTTYYRDGDNFGFWMSFGTLVKFDTIDFNNLNIDGTPVSLVEESLDTKAKFKKMLNAKSAGYACIIFKRESMLTYLLKQAKEYILGAKKEDLNRVCLEDLLRNVSRKGILGIVYQKVETLNNMYLPAFDYTTVSVKDIVCPALCFIYDDEYIWMIYNKEDKEIDFLSYKGDIYTFSDDNAAVSVYPNATLSKVNKVNPDNFVLFTGFQNLEVNNVLDIYFDGGDQILKSRNSQFAIDITAFDDFYSKQIKSFNADFNTPKEIIRTYGSNKYAFITGLVHYQEFHPLPNTTEYELQMNTIPSIGSIIDAVDKKAHLNNIMLSNYGYMSQAGFNAPLKNFLAYAQRVKSQLTGQGKPPKNSDNPDMFIFTSTVDLFRNGYFTFKDNSTNKYLTLLADRDIYTDFSMMDFSNEIKKLITTSVKAELKQGPNPDLKPIAEAARRRYNDFGRNLVHGQIYSLKSEITKKVAVCGQKERWEFEKVSDNMYVNNKPVDEVCNHAILFEDAFQNTLKKYFDTVPEKGFISEYIKAGKLTVDETGYHIDVKLDNSSKTNAYLFDDIGISVANIPDNMKSNEYFKIEPKMIVTNNSFRKIDDEDYNMFHISVGYELTINQEKMTQAIINKGDGKPKTTAVQAYKGRIAAAHDEISDAESVEPDQKMVTGVKQAKEKAALKTAIDKKFIPIGAEVDIAYKQGKILVSIGGREFYEPFVTDNGLRLNMNMYVSSLDVFEVGIRNMMLSNVIEEIYDGISIQKDFVNLQQVALKKIAVSPDMNMGVAEFSFRDVPAVINGQLYQPGEPVIYSFDLDVDIDYIDDKTNKRVVFWDINIEYQTIYPIDAKRKIANAEEILNDENCFLVNHHVPVTVGLDAEEYIYEKKSQAVADGYYAFVNFSKGN